MNLSYSSCMVQEKTTIKKNPAVISGIPTASGRCVIMQKYPPTPKSISPAKNRATYDTTFFRIWLFFLFLLFMCFLLVLYAGMILASNLSPKRFRLRYAVSSRSTASSSSSFISLFRQ